MIKNKENKVNSGQHTDGRTKRGGRLCNWWQRWDSGVTRKINASKDLNKRERERERERENWWQRCDK